MLVWIAGNVSIPLMRLLGGAFSFTRVSVGEIALFAACAYIITRLALVPFYRGKSGIKAASVPISRVLAVFVISYLLIWLPVALSPRLPAGAVDADKLCAICLSLSKEANEQYKYYDASSENVTRRVGEAVFNLTGEYSAAKISVWPEWMRALNLAGVCLPWSGEALVRGDMPLIALPFVTAHESAHQIGYGREAEANYLAYRALRLDEGLSYSGVMYALYYSMRELKEISAPDYNAVIGGMEKRVFDDYATLVSFSRKPAGFKGGAADAFLRLSGQSGRDSYGQMVDFLLSDERISFADEVDADEADNDAHDLCPGYGLAVQEIAHEYKGD